MPITVNLCVYIWSTLRWQQNKLDEKRKYKPLFYRQINGLCVTCRDPFEFYFLAPENRNDCGKRDYSAINGAKNSSIMH